MTLLTPTFVERTNGQAGPVHITPPHEPLRETAGQPAPIASAPPGVLREQKLPLKVAIIGTAPSSRMLAPFNDPSWTIWCCSPGNMNVMPRVDVWFELHSNLLWPKHASYGAPYIEWLKQQKFPIFMQDQSLIPHANVFPMFELVQEFGQDFFTSSFAWMMAYAMKCGAVEIALYGVDMASRNEYILQRPGFYYFRHMAERRGVKVFAPHESDIMQSPPLYGYVDSTPFGRKVLARKDEVNERIAQMTPQRDSLTHNITYLQGAQEDVDYFESIWSGIANEIILLKQRNAYLEAQLSQLSAPATFPPPGVEPVSSLVLVGAETPIRRRRRRRKELPVISPGANGELAMDQAPLMESLDG